MNTSHILSYEQYNEIEKRGFKMPYIVEISSANQSLLFYGSDHSNNPEHPQNKDIEDRWSAFISNNPKPIALVEGHFDEVPESVTIDKTSLIIKGGEGQFVVYLARRDKVEVVSPEPDRLSEANQLASEFGRDNVIFFYFVRQLALWNRFSANPNIHSDAQKMLKLMETTYRWDKTDFSVKHMEATHLKLFNNRLPWNNAKWLYDLTTPTPNELITNDLAIKSGDLRDEHILREIIKYWQAGKSPFIVFGSANAIRLKPALLKKLI